jgi:hypothetical protein
MQWPLISQLHGSVSQREQLFFFVTDQTPRPDIFEQFLKPFSHYFTFLVAVLNPKATASSCWII